MLPSLAAALPWLTLSDALLVLGPAPNGCELERGVNILAVGHSLVG